MPRWNSKLPNRIAAENVNSYGTEDNSSDNRDCRRHCSGWARSAAVSETQGWPVRMRWLSGVWQLVRGVLRQAVGLATCKIMGLTLEVPPLLAAEW